MTSAARTTDRRSRGFTLLELIVVLSIAAIVLAGGVGMMIYSSDERELSDVSSGIELLAKKARTMAILQQTPYALEFRDGVVKLLPLANAGMDETRLTSGRQVGGEVDDESAGVVDSYHLSGDVGMFVRRWNSDAWLTTRNKSIHIWRFDPNGISEPLGVRLTLNDSWSEDTYHPLTATIRDRQFEMR
ncbi:MAG: type II secretion system protein [Verrucomicrobiae bacterium]|nr:type II secretion system protein [Verrucomicrobiae bacterium]MCP5546945.1 type II secretion system protein [Akkermansiaceae bacterium]